ncbi:hypothetical protein MMC27_006905 [Xylographa pallens]|nr:hypothetical protein [Xylographa pallens]
MEEDPDPLITQLFCPEDLPVGMYGDPEENRGMRHAFELVGHTWYGWSSLNFTSLAHLCSADGNQKGNMGGRVRPNDDEWIALALRETIFNRRIPPISQWGNVPEAQGQSDDGWGQTDTGWDYTGDGWLYHAADGRCAETSDRARITQRPRWCPPRPAGRGRVVRVGHPLQPATLPMRGRPPL